LSIATRRVADRAFGQCAMKVFQTAIAKLVERKDLAFEEMRLVMEELMTGRATQAQIGAFLAALRMKGETVEELAAAATVMRQKAVSVPVLSSSPNEVILDTCGTGGDRKHTFNISTAAALVAAGAGVKVAKHGNRSVSSACGSADVWEALGIPLIASPAKVAACIRKIGIGFLFAPAVHQAMKFAAGPRKELGIQTFFNLLGPLTNPAGVTVQLTGTFRRELTGTLARVLSTLECRRAMVVHGADGLDEISLSAPTFVAELREAEVDFYEIRPEDFGIQRAEPDAVRGGSAQENARIILSVLGGARGPCRDVVVLNAGAALYIAGTVESIREGIDLASEILDQGQAMQKLESLIAWARSEGTREDGTGCVPSA